MNNLEKYNAIFMDTFAAEEADLNEEFTSANVEAWDSVGHMNLISYLEEEFDIMMESDDIVELQSYEAGKEILAKYGIEF